MLTMDGWMVDTYLLTIWDLPYGIVRLPAKLMLLGNYDTYMILTYMIWDYDAAGYYDTGICLLWMDGW